MARKENYISWPKMAFAAVLMIGLFVVLMVREQDKLTQLQAQDASLQMEMRLMEGTQDALLAQLQRVGSDGYVENEARNTYGFIKEGEIVFAFQHPDMLNGYTQEEYQIIMEELR